MQCALSCLCTPYDTVLHARLEGPVVPEPHNDADLQWPRSTQNGPKPEQQQPAQAGNSNAPAAGEHKLQQHAPGALSAVPAASSVPAVAPRKAADDDAAFSGYLMQGALDHLLHVTSSTQVCFFLGHMREGVVLHAA